MVFTDWDTLLRRNGGKFGLVKVPCSAMINDELYDVIGIEPHGDIVIWSGRRFERSMRKRQPPYEGGNFDYTDIFVER